MNTGPIAAAKQINQLIERGVFAVLLNPVQVYFIDPDSFSCPPES
jgi:hypothetical protein